MGAMQVALLKWLVSLNLFLQSLKDLLNLSAHSIMNKSRSMNVMWRPLMVILHVCERKKETQQSASLSESS